VFQKLSFVSHHKHQTKTNRLITIMKTRLTLIAAGILFLSSTILKAEVAIGEMAPEFTLKDLNGTSHNLSDFRGKFVVLEWFNSECPFVVKFYQPGAMQAMQEKYAAKGVVWLAINSTSPLHQDFHDIHASKELFNKWNMKATALLLDADGEVGKKFNARTTPHMFVINPEGKLVYQGAIDNKRSTRSSDIEGAENFVAKALEAAMSGKAVETPSTRPHGCSVKYN
jgi:peroxiredoxin